MTTDERIQAKTTCEIFAALPTLLRFYSLEKNKLFRCDTYTYYVAKNVFQRVKESVLKDVTLQVNAAKGNNNFPIPLQNSRLGFYKLCKYIMHCSIMNGYEKKTEWPVLK